MASLQESNETELERKPFAGSPVWRGVFSTVLYLAAFTAVRQRTRHVYVPAGQYAGLCILVPICFDADCFDGTTAAKDVEKQYLALHTIFAESIAGLAVAACLLVGNCVFFPGDCCHNASYQPLASAAYCVCGSLSGV